MRTPHPNQYADRCTGPPPTAVIDFDLRRTATHPANVRVLGPGGDPPWSQNLHACSGALPRSRGSRRAFALVSTFEQTSVAGFRLLINKFRNIGGNKSAVPEICPGGRANCSTSSHNNRSEPTPQLSGCASHLNLQCAERTGGSHRHAGGVRGWRVGGTSDGRIREAAGDRWWCVVAVAACGCRARFQRVDDDSCAGTCLRVESNRL